MSMPQADSSVTGFRPFFNPATGEWITYTALAEDSDGQLVRFTWRSVPGGVITEHIHPHQEERFTILAGEAHFTLNGAELVAGAGETVVVPAGVPHSEGNPGPAEIDGVVELRPALHTKEWHEALAGLVADGKTTPRGAPKQPAPARRHLLALPPRKPGHLTAYLGPEPHAPATVGAGQGLRRPPLLRPLGQPDLRNWRLARFRPVVAGCCTGPFEAVEDQVEPKPELVAVVIAGPQDVLGRQLGKVGVPARAPRVPERSFTGVHPQQTWMGRGQRSARRRRLPPQRSTPRAGTRR